MANEQLQANPVSDLMQKLLKEKRSARTFQERKHLDWNDNYELSRNKVRTNRLTQRQAVNIPLMRETVKTLLARIDDPPNIDWKELAGDEQKELYYQEIWNDIFKRNKLEWIDVLDKKNVLLYGISTKKLNLNEKGVDVQVLDVFDVVYDPLMNPLDVETARFIVHQNIFKSLREILADKRYSQKGKDELKAWLNSREGVVQTSQNKEEWDKKLERLKAMGVDSTEFPLFAGGDTIVNLTEHYTLVWDSKAKAFERRVVVYANDTTELLNKPLEDLIGATCWPFVTWSDDPETNDIYPDSAADLVRTPNKVLNVWFSQMVENRTLRNFQMHWYDATIQGYKPQTYEPGPGRMLPAPGDPNKTILPVNIQGLDETLTAIDFLIRIVERGSGATAIEKGVSEKKQITLGEVEILVGKAMERTISMAKFYRGAWYELAKKWDKLMQANAPEIMELYKISKDGKLYPKKLYAADWVSKEGYEPIVSSSSEQEEEQTKGIQKFIFILQQFPDNPVLKRIAQKRMLELIDLTPDELRQVQEAEDQKLEQMIEAPGMAGPGGGAMMPGGQMMQGGQPSPEELISAVQGKLQELNTG